MLKLIQLLIFIHSFQVFNGEVVRVAECKQGSDRCPELPIGERGCFARPGDPAKPFPGCCPILECVGWE
ncbi:hypothetical protein ILUMI_11625 [Ignelater luminosus]|uniref:Single domain-containing protein n=1 Tax=Ignelater luminosus TaxID=2038154 RepID=A0A8K0CZS4_IGNLU|nr:hypothetical protein ILUMI_11625 [Ignelater luminosus]